MTEPAATGPLLAFDTSGAVGSVAVGRGSEVLAETTLPVRGEHAARLIPTIAETLDTAGIARSDLVGIVVGAGPGSFTGVRVAAATAKGLAHALGIDVWAVSSLVATALAGGDSGNRYVLFDARSDRVYGACYAVRDDGIDTIHEPHAGTLTDVFASRFPADCVFVGDGADRHRREIEAAGFSLADGVEHPTGRALLRWLAFHPTAPPVDSLLWEPVYLRASGAEQAWGRMSQRALRVE